MPRWSSRMRGWPEPCPGNAPAVTGLQFLAIVKVAATHDLCCSTPPPDMTLVHEAGQDLKGTYSPSSIILSRHSRPGHLFCASSQSSILRWRPLTADRAATWFGGYYSRLINPGERTSGQPHLGAEQGWRDKYSSSELRSQVPASTLSQAEVRGCPPILVRCRVHLHIEGKPALWSARYRTCSDVHIIQRIPMSMIASLGQLVPDLDGLAAQVSRGV